MWVIILGWVATAQAGVNVALASNLGGASLLAAAVSVSSTAVLCGLWAGGQEMAERSQDKAAAPRRWPEWWKFLGGCIGFLYLGSSVLIVPRLGFSLTYTLLVSGSITAGVAYDHYGTLGMVRAPIDLWKILAVALCVAGVFLNVVAQVEADQAARRGRVGPGEVAIESLVTFAIGCTLPLQGMLNRALGQALKRPTEAATVQCVVNALCCAVGYGISVGAGLSAAGGVADGAASAPWWTWLGGVGGLLLVYSGMTFIAVVGVGPYFILITLGQLSSSLVWDATGVFIPHRVPPTWQRLVGAGVAMLAFLLLTHSRSLAALERARDPSIAGGRERLLQGDEEEGSGQVSPALSTASLHAEMKSTR